jgi:hypothetical protein
MKSSPDAAARPMPVPSPAEGARLRNLHLVPAPLEEETNPAITVRVPETEQTITRTFEGVEFTIAQDDHVFADTERDLYGVLNDDVVNAARLRVGPEFSTEFRGTLVKDDEDIREELIAHQLNRYGRLNRTADFSDTKQINKSIDKIMSADPDIGRKALAVLRTLDVVRDTTQAEQGHAAACIGTIHDDGSRRWAVLAKIGEGADAYKRRSDGTLVLITPTDAQMAALAERTNKPTPALYVRELKPKTETQPAEELLLVKDDPENVLLTGKLAGA